MENEFGLTLAIEPPKDSERPRPKHFSSWFDWTAWQRFRAFGCAAVGNEVFLGLAMSAEPFNPGASFSIEGGALTPEAARHMARRLSAAADLAEQN